jgi:hypothetical protein
MAVCFSVLLYFTVCYSVLLHQLCFCYVAFDHVEVINMSLESVRAATSWPATVLVCAPAYDPDGHTLFVTCCRNLSLLYVFMYQE